MTLFSCWERCSGGAQVSWRVAFFCQEVVSLFCLHIRTSCLSLIHFLNQSSHTSTLQYKVLCETSYQILTQNLQWHQISQPSNGPRLSRRPDNVSCLFTPIFPISGTDMFKPSYTRRSQSRSQDQTRFSLTSSTPECATPISMPSMGTGH